MNKKMIRLTENDLHKIVKECAKRVLKEEDSGKFTTPFKIDAPYQTGNRNYTKRYGNGSLPSNLGVISVEVRECINHICEMNSCDWKTAASDIAWYAKKMIPEEEWENLACQIYMGENNTRTVSKPKQSRKKTTKKRKKNETII